MSGTLSRVRAPDPRPAGLLAKLAANARSRASAGPVVVIVAVVVAANLLYLVGVVEPSPLYSVANVGVRTAGHLLPGLATIDPNYGYTAQALGHRAALDILHGQLPWWNPFEGVGAPLAGEMQSAAFFPPTLLLALSWGQLLFHMLLEAVAGIATYRILVRLEVAPWIATAGGCAFALNGTFSWFQHAPVNPVAFLPLLILGVERARQSALAGTGHRWGLVALALALSIYAGFPETAYLDALLVLTWALVRTVGVPRAQLVSYGSKLAAGVVVGLLLAAPIIAAFVAYLPAGNLAGHASNFNGVAIPRAGITALLFPYAFGPIFAAHTPRTGTLDAVWGSVGGYLSAASLALMAIALYSRRLRPLRLVLLVWIIVTVGRTYGVAPFQQLFGLLPGMSHVAAYRYLPASFELAAVVLAVLGIDDVRRRAVPRWFAAPALLGALVVAGLAAYAGRSIFDSISTLPHHLAAEAVWLAWGFGMIAVIGAAVLARGRLRGGVLVACLVIDALGMFIAPELSAPRHVAVDVRFIDWMQRHVGVQRFYTLGPIHPDYGSYFGLPQANINDLPIPRRYSEYITTALDPNVNPIQFTGNKALEPSGITPLQAFESHLAGYRSIGVAYLVATTGEVPTQIARALHLRRAYSDQFATVYRVPHPATYYSVVRTKGCTLSHETFTSVVADCPVPAMVERRQLAMDGWSATANGRPVPVKLAGKLFQGVRLAPGETRLEYTFIPPREGLALGALLVGLVALLGGCWRGARRQPGSQSRPRPTS